MTHDLQGLARAAIDAAGGGAVVGRILGIPKTTVQSWKDNRVPAVYVQRLARLAKLAPAAIRPDIFLPVDPSGHAPVSSADAVLVGCESVVGSGS